MIMSCAILSEVAADISAERKANRLSWSFPTRKRRKMSEWAGESE